MIWKLKTPKMTLADAGALARMVAGEADPRPVSLVFDKAIAQLEVTKAHAEYRGAFRRLAVKWSVTRYDGLGQLELNSGTTSRLDLAWQSILLEVAQLALPPALELSVFESQQRLAQRASSVDGAVKLYRELLRRRSGRRWSVRVGSGDRRSTITISSMPIERVDGSMKASDAALLAALAGRLEILNPVNGLTIPDSADDRTRFALAFAGLDAETNMRREIPGSGQ